jgi:hypothetical protein
MNRFHFLALIIIGVAIALRNRISDTWLAVAIGVGVVFTILGLVELYRGRRWR